MANAPSAVVMAAGQGIGAGIARHLHSVGYRLVLLAMRNALAAWMKMYADTYGPKGIRINNVLPGWFDNTAGGAGDRFVGNIPLRRLGLMSELGGLIAFLASPAGAYITGQNLRVDGGLARPMSAIPLR